MRERAAAKVAGRVNGLGQQRRPAACPGKRAAALRVALKLGCGCVARRLQLHCGICSSLAPRLEGKILAAKHQPFRRHNTSLQLWPAAILTAVEDGILPPGMAPLGRRTDGRWPSDDPPGKVPGSRAAGLYLVCQ